MNQTQTLSQNAFFRAPVGKTFLVAGPCSAESETQVLATAHALKDTAQLFRAGLWKPRTRPGNFEGVGAVGLPWLQRVKTETGLPVTCEVATARHVELALRHDVDVLWIGARTTVNPFSVQEIANALAGTRVPVMVKNPVSPDLALWLGALERLENAHVGPLAAVHRGFSTFNNAPYRNRPQWNLAIEFKRRASQVPLLCDPSHIVGQRDLLLPVAQKALDLAMDGLMIETHPSPTEALSDPDQQLTPTDLVSLMDQLHVRRTDPAALSSAEWIGELRREIDHLDEELLEVLARRARLSRLIGEFKKANNLSVLQVKRWDEVLRKRLQRASQHALDPDFVRSIFQQVHQFSISVQTRIMNAPPIRRKEDQ